MDVSEDRPPGGDLRSIVSEIVRAELAPVRAYLATIGEALADVVERMDRAEPLPPAPAPNLEPVLRAMTEGMRATLESVQGMDARVADGLLALDARLSAAVEELVTGRVGRPPEGS